MNQITNEINTLIKNSPSKQISQFQMEESKKQKKTYCKISQNIRQQIIKEVLQEKRPYQEVASRYGILLSTCKSIITTFLSEGRIGKKQRRIRKMKKITTTYNITINPHYPQDSSVSITTTISDIQEPSIKSKQDKGDQDSGMQNDKEIQQKIEKFFRGYLLSYDQKYRSQCYSSDTNQNSSITTQKMDN